MAGTQLSDDADEEPFDIPLSGRSAEADGDDVPDADDLCPGFDDALDADLDGQPDGCDLCPADPDNDADAVGWCAEVDPCPVDPENDADGHGWCGSEDLCPLAWDPAQTDVNGDGLGDACDLFFAATGSCAGTLEFFTSGLTPRGAVAVIASAIPGATVIPRAPAPGL